VARRTAAERVAKWDRRYTGDRLKEVADQDKGLMLENNKARTTDLVQYEDATRQVLNAEGISVLQVADYLSFSREVWKKKNLFAGETLKVEVAVLIQKAVARGLSQAVCEAIRTSVYTIDRPTTPLAEPS
jgi:hypothetical protein